MNYIRTLLATAIITLAIAAGFNWFIDPYGMYWSPLIEGINANKSEAGNRSRTSKPYVLSKLKPSTLIVGNSRVEMGLNPEHPLIAGKAYNIGIPGLGYRDQISIAINEVESNPNLRHIILSLDYLDFLHTETELETPLKDLAARYESNSSKLKPASSLELSQMLLSLETMESNFLTILKQSMNTSSITNRGFNTAPLLFRQLKVRGSNRYFHKKYLNSI